MLARAPVKSCRLQAQEQGLLWDVCYQQDWQILSMWLDATVEERALPPASFGLPAELRIISVRWLAPFLGRHWPAEHPPHAVLTDRKRAGWQKWLPTASQIHFPGACEDVRRLAPLALMRLGRHSGTLRRGEAGRTSWWTRRYFSPSGPESVVWCAQDGWINAMIPGRGGFSITPVFS